MAGAYSVGTNNRYAMFLGEEDESADPQDITKLVQAEKAKKTLKPVLKEPKVENKVQKEVEVKPVKKPAQPEKPVKNDDGEDMETVRNRRNREEKPTNETRPSRNGEVSRPSGPPRRADSDRRDGDGVRRDIESRQRRERRDWNEAEGDGQNRRAPGSGPVRPYRPRPDGTPTNRRKREFERKSGSDKTGVKSVDKREGGGAHNWGTHKDDIPMTATPNSPDPVSGEDTDGGDNKTDNLDNLAEKKDEAPVEIIEEVQELTLDEYRALRGKRQQPQYNLRRAGEGEDQAQWNGLVVLDKKKKEAGTDDDDEMESLDCPQRAGRQKHVLDIDITFKEARKFGGGRFAGGRGGARPPPRDRENRDIREEKRDGNDGKPTGPRRQFNGPREIKSGQQDGNTWNRDPTAPRVDDEKAFPSLG